MADGLCATKKINSSVADNFKFHYVEFLKITIQKDDELVCFDFYNDRFDVFLEKCLPDRKQLWHISKLIFVLSHGQSSIERDFSFSINRVNRHKHERKISRLTKANIWLNHEWRFRD